MSAEIASIASASANITSTTITIPKQFHGEIIGTKGTTLNAIIGEDAVVNVSFGAKGGADDQVVIRGTPEEITRVQKEMERIVAEAKDHEITNSYVTVFEVEQANVRHVGHSLSQDPSTMVIDMPRAE